MEFWEYNVVYTDFEYVDERRLNAFGNDRWELISMAALPYERFQFVFRRPQWKVPPPQAETMDSAFPYTGDTIDMPPPFASPGASAPLGPIETIDSLPYSMELDTPLPPEPPVHRDSGEEGDSHRR
jgi:hypothetical protein